jgi:hypothetical protein
MELYVTEFEIFSTLRSAVQIRNSVFPILVTFQFAA